MLGRKLPRGFSNGRNRSGEKPLSLRDKIDNRYSIYLIANSILTL